MAVLEFVAFTDFTPADCTEQHGAAKHDPLMSLKVVSGALLSAPACLHGEEDVARMMDRSSGFQEPH